MASWNVSTHLTCVCTKTNLFVEYSVNGKTMKLKIFCHSSCLFTFWVRCLGFQPLCHHHTWSKNRNFLWHFFHVSWWLEDPSWTMNNEKDAFWFHSGFLLPFGFSSPDFSYLINSNVTESSTMPRPWKKNVLQPIHQVDTSMKSTEREAQSPRRES